MPEQYQITGKQILDAAAWRVAKRINQRTGYWKTDLISEEFDFVTILLDELIVIANESQLPDGDGVNVPTALWAESWLRKFEAKENQHG